jgi:hypothetical protein
MRPIGVALRLLALPATVAATYVVFFGATWYLYLWWIPGIPDHGVVAVPVLPGLLFWYLVAPAYHQPHVLTVWLLACSTYFVPAFVAGVLAERSRERLLSFLVVLVFLCLALLTVWNGRFAYFGEYPYTSGRALALTVRDWSVVVLVTALGVALGTLSARRHGLRRKDLPA